MSRFVHSLFLVHAALLLGAPAVSAQVTATTNPDVARMREFNHPAKTLKEWRAQVEAAIVKVTNVRVDRTGDGLDITLETDGKVVPQQVLRDQQVIRLDDALSNISSVISAGNNGGREGSFSIRGFGKQFSGW